MARDRSAEPRAAVANSPLPDVASAVPCSRSRSRSRVKARVQALPTPSRRQRKKGPLQQGQQSEHVPGQRQPEDDVKDSRGRKRCASPKGPPKRHCQDTNSCTDEPQPANMAEGGLQILEPMPHVTASLGQAAMCQDALTIPQEPQAQLAHYASQSVATPAKWSPPAPMDRDPPNSHCSMGPDMVSPLLTPCTTHRKQFDQLSLFPGFDSDPFVAAGHAHPQAPHGRRLLFQSFAVTICAFYAALRVDQIQETTMFAVLAVLWLHSVLVAVLAPPASDSWSLRWLFAPLPWQLVMLGMCYFFAFRMPLLEELSSMAWAEELLNSMSEFFIADDFVSNLATDLTAT